MKRIVTLLATVLLLSFPVSAFAAEINEVPGKQGVAVYGYCESDKNYDEIVIGAEDLDSVELPDGVTISGKSDSEADNGLRVIIIPVTADEEAEAYKWMSGTAKKLGEEPAAYYLAFYRGTSPALSEGSIAITVTERPGSKLYYMDGNAETKEISCTAESGNVSFTMERTGYYISVKTKDTPTPTPDAPKTGDDSSIGLCLLIMAASAAVLAIIYRSRKESVSKC